MDTSWRAGAPSRGLFRIAVLLAAVIGSASLGPACRADDVFTHSYLLMTRDPTCMQLVWQTSTGVGGGRVDWGYWGQSMDYGAQAYGTHQNIRDDAYPLRSAQDITTWTAEICGVSPGQRISYQVHVLDKHGNDIASWSNDFVLPLDPAAKHLTFYGYGDTRDCEMDFENVTHALREEVDQAPDQTQLETVLLHSGDVVYNGGQTTISYSDNHWLRYLSEYEDAQHLLEWIPVTVAMGNHDFNWESSGNYPKYYFMDFPYEHYDNSLGMVPYIDDNGKLEVPGGTDSMNDAYYSYDYGPIHVAALDTYTDGELDSLGGCHIGSGLESGKAQARWLERDLSSSDKPWKILMMHVPVIGSCSMDDSDTDSRSTIESIAAAQGVSLVVAGHVHRYRKDVNPDNGIVHLILGGGGAAIDEWCEGCFFHYARFHVVDDGHLAVDIIQVAGDGSSWVARSFTVTRNAPDADSASFASAAGPLDYRVPVRFSCTTPGAHGSHDWDFGDGTTSQEENPLHTFPKPTESEGLHTYTVSLGLTSGSGQQYVAAKEIQVYNGGNLEILPSLDYSSQYALYLTPPGETFDELRDFKAINSGTQSAFFDKIPPGEYTVTLYALGYNDWQGRVTVPQGGTKLYYPEPTRQSHPGDTVAIGSVPRGAQVTINPGSADQITGTTPFYARICGIPMMIGCGATTITYRVQNGQTIVERTGDVQFTGETRGECEPCDGRPSTFYVDARGDSAAGGGPHRQAVLRGPSDQKVLKNGSAVLRIEAQPREGVTYRWFEGESGDTSRPITLATGDLYMTPRLKGTAKYWVRVYGGAWTRDSRTATVSVESKGPKLLFAQGKKVVPGQTATIKGRPFNEADPDENRVYFDDLQAQVVNVRRHHITVDIPEGLAGRTTALVRVKVDGVWSIPRRLWIATVSSVQGGIPPQGCH